MQSNLSWETHITQNYLKNKQLKLLSKRWVQKKNCSVKKQLMLIQKGKSISICPIPSLKSFLPGKKGILTMITHYFCGSSIIVGQMELLPSLSFCHFLTSMIPQYSYLLRESVSSKNLCSSYKYLSMPLFFYSSSCLNK